MFVVAKEPENCEENLHLAKEIHLVLQEKYLRISRGIFYRNYKIQ
ncbi:stage II sporulation protein P [Metabacillus fastidiosus]